MAKDNYIYILTNPSFPDYVKIGYSEDVKARVEQLNRTECTPFGFRIYATYKVGEGLKDIPLHELIDLLDPSLRSRDDINGKLRVREFFALHPETAYKILYNIAKINGLEGNLKLYKPTKLEKEDEIQAVEVRQLNLNRHHLKDVKFTSSLTGKHYLGTTGDDGTLCIIDLDEDKEILNNSHPSKRLIVRQALIDLGEKPSENATLYQLYRMLEKI